MSRNFGSDRPDWKAERDRIDLAAVVTARLGPAPGRTGEHGRRLWWHCPFHEDRNPSLCVEPGKPFWRCFGCGKNGDAANFVMELEGVPFPKAAASLIGGGPPTRHHTSPPPRPRPKPPAEHSGLPLEAAQALVEESSARLWTPEGTEALASLTGHRCLTPETIRKAPLGWTPGVRIPAKDGGTYVARGVVISWYEGDRLALVKLRQPDGERPKYAEAFRDRPILYPDPRVIRPGQPLIVVEGELDCLLLAQELGELAVVVTRGSASSGFESARALMRPAAPWYIATDADPAGDRAAEGWPARARRASPPSPFKDWTEARQAGVNLLRWWTDRLAGIESPPLFSWEELSRQTWGAPPTDAVSIVVPGDWRKVVAGWPHDRWIAWHRRWGEMAPPGSGAEAIEAAQRSAYEELASGDEGPEL